MGGEVQPSVHVDVKTGVQVPNLQTFFESEHSNEFPFPHSVKTKGVQKTNQINWVFEFDVLHVTTRSKFCLVTENWKLGLLPCEVRLPISKAAQ